MTITTRSERVSAFGSAHTPAAVGPGSYATEKLGSGFKDAGHKPLFSGFAASEKRNLNKNKTTSAMTPGPGAYIDDAYQNSPKVPSNVFATKASRFAPSAPGSTIFRPSSIQDNPGPGSYRPSSGLSPNQTQNQRQELDGRAVNKFAHFVKASAPAIPKKEQSYGYFQVGSELKAQPQPANVYSGIGQDTVGPAAYNSHRQIWNERENVAPSLRSTVKREVWEENAPHASVPGPGHYYEDPVSPSSELVVAGTGGKGLRGRKKTGKHERASAVFASKVPILPNPKPNSQYDPERDMEISAKESRLRYQLERQKTNIMKAKIEAFGSTMGRAELSSQLNAPFSNPSFTMTPGPGMYSDRTHSLKGQKKHRAPASSGDREESMGFSSATERFCLAKPKKPSVPGPGAYKSETPRSLNHSVKSKSTIGRNGIFGSTSERHVWEHLNRLKTADEFTPGPGAYEKPVETHAGHFPLAANSAAFKSNSHRFSKVTNPHAPPAVGQYDIPASLGLSAAGSSGFPNEKPGGGATSPPCSARGTGGGASAGFLSRCERQVFDTKDVRDLPDPGAYAADGDARMEGYNGTTARQGMVLTRFNEVRPSIGNEERFRVKPTVPENVGPRAYSIPGTVGSKSFNVTVAQRGNVSQVTPQRYQQA